MNIRAKCNNRECDAYGIEKSVAFGQALGYGADNDRVKCPQCGVLMTTTKSMNTQDKVRGKTMPRRASPKLGPRK